MTQGALFVNSENPEQKGYKGAAMFSGCGSCRYWLYRVWDPGKPVVMFIGLNPSTADATENDQTIASAMRIAKHNGYGGMYMMNCFPFISTDPDALPVNFESAMETAKIAYNDVLMLEIALECKDIVFAWGAFKVVRKMLRDRAMISMFPGPKVIGLNKNGTPKHPLYQPEKTKLQNAYFK